MSAKKLSSEDKFQKEAKKYVINTVRGSRRTLHIKNTKSCPWSKFLIEYVDFDTLEDAMNCCMALKCCERCFKSQNLTDMEDKK